MTYLSFASALLPAALLFGGPSVIAPDLARKCGGLPTGGDPLVAVDGEFVKAQPDSVVKDVGAEEVLAIAIVCMDPRDSTFNRRRGIPVISIWTRQAPSAYVEPLLSAILSAQDAHFREEGAYIDDLADIAYPDRLAPLRVTLETDADGWIAKAVFGRSFATCFVFDGDTPPPDPRVTRREPRCLQEPVPAR